MTVKRMKRELSQYAELDGFKNITEAIGAEVRKKQITNQPVTLNVEDSDIQTVPPPIFQKSKLGKYIFKAIDY